MLRRLFFLAIFGVAAMAGWDWFDAHFPKWDEEVQLSDGRMMRVHRAQRFDIEDTLTESELSFGLPEFGPMVWREQLYPVLVDVWKDKVYVVGQLPSKSGYRYLESRFSYVAFVHSGGEWQRVEFLSLPEPIRRQENIPFCARGPELASWKSKQVLWCDYTGQITPTASRRIDLQARERNAQVIQNFERNVVNVKDSSIGSPSTVKLK